MALLDARIMLGALRSALTARRLRYPADLHRLQVAVAAEDGLPGLSIPCDGVRAREWAEASPESRPDARLSEDRV